MPDALEDQVAESRSSLLALMDRLEREETLDAKARLLDKGAAAVASGSRRSLLRGDWLGHALHPLLTDFPLGCWLSAGFLDLCGGRRSRRAAQRLIATGLLLTPPTIASGLADYRSLNQPRTRRVAVVHAGANTVVTALYFWSWRARRQNRHALGVILGMVGGLCAWFSGYLGGHLSFARGAGVGERGVINLSSSQLDQIGSSAPGEGGVAEGSGSFSSIGSSGSGPAGRSALS
jgi:uncharacterized membrane protein